MGILRMLQRRRVRTAFGKYLSPEVIEKLLRETKAEISLLEVKHFQFVLTLADDTNPQEVPATLSKITRTLIQHHSTVTDVTSSLVLALLAYPFRKATPRRHAGSLSARCFARTATESALLMENATPPSGCLEAVSGGHTAR